jgi:hypothetical protein
MKPGSATCQSGIMAAYNTALLNTHGTNKIYKKVTLRTVEVPFDDK